MPYGLIVRLLGALAVVAAIAGAWFYVDRSCWSTACHKAVSRAEKAEGLMKEAQDRATHLALLWSESINNVEKVYVQQVEQRATRFADLHQRAADAVRRHSSGRIVLRGPAIGVMRDISREANAGHPTAPEVDQRPPEAVPPAAEVYIDAEGFVMSWEEAASAYADARDRHAACVAAYESLRKP